MQICAGVLCLLGTFDLGIVGLLQDREIDGLNEQLEEDSRCLEHLQLQLLQERSKRAEIERENTMLKEQVDMLVNMIQEDEEEGAEEP